MKKFNLYIAIFSVLVDALAIYFGLVVAYYLRQEGILEIYQWPLDQYLRFVSIMIPVWLLLFASQGLYSVRTIPKGWNAFGRLLIGLLSGWGVMIITLYLWRSPEAQAFPRLVIAYGLFATFVFTFLGRIFLGNVILGFYRLKIGLIRTVVIVGSHGAKIAETLQNNIRNGRKIIATLDSDYIKKLDQHVKDQPIDEIVCADSDLDEDGLLDLLNWSEENSANFTLVPSLLSVRTTNVESGTLGGSPVLFFKRTPLEGWGRVFKRVFDLIAVLILLIIAVPIMLIVAILIYIVSPGPVIFNQVRIGQDGKPFSFHKFRSMYADWPKRFPDAKDWSADENTDPRITGIGRFIRKTNLDELPQLFDVLLGKMSLVGPRPEQPKYVEQFGKEIPKYLSRHHVKTGMTGWAQVNGLRGDTSIKDRVKYDLFYIENWSIWFDIRIIIATLIQTIRKLV